jgi:hypothetical protein
MGLKDIADEYPKTCGSIEARRFATQEGGHVVASGQGVADQAASRPASSAED